MTATGNLLVVAAYLIGSLPTGYILAALAGVDIRESGSGNIGATNVARVVGMRQGILTLAADTLKGLVPVATAHQLGVDAPTAGLVAAAAFLGHLYPVFLKFRGGKGVATALGVFLGLAPMATLIIILVFAVVVMISRTVSLSSMAAAVAAPVTFWILSYSWISIGVSAFIALMILLRHRDNIQRLRAGTESRFGSTNSR